MLEIAKLILVVNIMMITMNKILNPINKCGTFFIILSFLCFGLSSNVYAQKTIKVAFGNALAPWVFPQDNNGIIVDIISEALTPSGYTIEYIYVPYTGVPQNYQEARRLYQLSAAQDPAKTTEVGASAHESLDRIGEKIRALN